jgi:hypothetical protein
VDLLWICFSADVRDRVPTDVTVYRGVPHGFRRYGNALERASKKWDEVMSDGISWAMSNPAAGPWEVKTD